MLSAIVKLFLFLAGAWLLLAVAPPDAALGLLALYLLVSLAATWPKVFFGK